jgi:hypothetical protein
MSILHPLSAEEIHRDFTHIGWFAFCPVYLAEDGAEGMNVCERNGVPAWWFGAAEVFMSLVIFMLSILPGDYEPQWGFIVTGEIKR